MHQGILSHPAGAEQEKLDLRENHSWKSGETVEGDHQEKEWIFHVFQRFFRLFADGLEVAVVPEFGKRGAGWGAGFLMG